MAIVLINPDRQLGAEKAEELREAVEDCILGLARDTQTPTFRGTLKLSSL